MRVLPCVVLLVAVSANAQSINISDFYYRDYLDFGQHKGAFGANNSTITKKDGTKFKIPQIPDFSASSNYGSLTSVGRGFAVTANHVESPNNVSDLRQWGLTKYNTPKESTEKSYGWDTKFLRLDKYVVEGQVGMLDIENKQKEDLEKFKTQLENFKDSDGNIYFYQAGSGIVTLRGTSNQQTFNTNGSGEMKGGGFGTFNGVDYYNSGIGFGYKPMTGFYNNITSGDSGSGIYAYDKNKNEWILLGVVSRDNGAISFASNKDFLDYQKQFEQKIDLSSGANWTLEKPVGSEIQIKNNGDSKQLQGNKDMIFSGNGEINIEVKTNIDRMQSGYAGGFVFMAGDSATSTNPTTYKFTNSGNYSFKGSGLDIGENVRVEWALKGVSGDSLHKIGKGELVIKTENNGSANLGTLKIGEGKVTLDTSTRAYDNIYITSGRGELTLTQGKAEALGASKNIARGDSPSTDSYTLSQDTTNNMGFYFGTGGGKLDLGGNSLTLNTIVANDSGATITSATKATLEIQGFGYDSSGSKTNTKADTIIHANIGESNTTNGANIDIVYSGDKNANNAVIASEQSERGNSQNSATLQSGLPRLSTESLAMTGNSEAHLIFDGNINTSGKIEVTNGNIALQGHATTHATISDSTIRNQVATAESGTQKGMPNYMDLSKPSTLNQPDWDNRSFKFGGIDLKGANLTLGRNATLESNITLDSTSKIEFGGNVKHFIDNLDGKNVTGSGFSYQQKVEGGTLSDEQTKIANQTISYKGTITATGGEIQSHIWDFNASLDLKSGAKLSADYLTLTDKDSVTLASGASASVKTLKLNNVSDSNLANIFKSGSSEKLKVTESLWFDNSNLDLGKLDSAHIDKSANYNIVGVKSTITGANSALSANVWLDGGNLSLKSLTLKKIDDLTLKDSVYLDNDSQGSDFAKLTLTESLRAENLDKAQIILKGKSEIIAPKIEFSGVQNGILALDSEAKLTGTNGNANVEVSGENSTLQIEMLGDKSFDINAQGGSKITLGLLEPSESQTASANFSGKITAKDSSIITTALESITASVDLSGNATLNAVDIVLENSHNSISLSDTATLTAQTITAKNLSNLTLNATNSANIDIKSFIFDNSTTNLTGNLIGKNIELKSSTIKTTSDLIFAHSATLTLDDKSKLEMANLKVENTNLTLNFADSATSTANLTNINLNNSANLTINSWDFGNTTTFSSSGDNSRVTFQNATYTQNSTPKTISVDSTISDNLTLFNVGHDSSKGESRFKTLDFNDKNLTFDENSKVQVKLDSSIKKGESSGITLGQYYTLISAGSIFDNRADSRIDFIFDDSVVENQRFFVVSKYDDEKKNILIKFLESAPNTFDELNKQISHNSSRYSEILKALTEARPNDEAIDIATRTDDYKVLDERIQAIDSDLATIAQGNKTRLTQNLLFSNDYTINTRIIQVRLAQRASKKHLRFAQNDTSYRIQSMIQGADRSDAMPSYGASSEDLQNSVWLNVGGGYFGGEAQMGFGATNIGYDRTFNVANSDIMIGAMLGFGGSKAHTSGLSENALFYNVGLYLHTIFDARGGKYGGHELQSNLNFSINDNSKTYDSQSAKNTAFGTLFSVYYKYNFIVASDNEMSHALKPVVLLALGHNRSGAFDTGTYRQSAYTSTNLSYGLGVEYNAVWSAHFYSVGFVFKDMAWNASDDAKLSLSGARNFIGYTIESAPRFSAELNLVGSHKITPNFYLQYGIAGMVDSGKNYGAKGDIKFGYRF